MMLFENFFKKQVRIPSVFRIEGEEDKSLPQKQKAPGSQARRGVPGMPATFQIPKNKGEMIDEYSD